MADGMSATQDEPVAWRWRQRGPKETEWQDWRVVGHKPQGPESSMFQFEPLYASSPTAIRAATVAECSAMCMDEALLYVGERAALPLTALVAKMSLLSPRPTVSEAWIREQADHWNPLKVELIASRIRAAFVARGYAIDA